MTKVPQNQDKDPESDFPSRLQELIVEFGSRSALSRASGIAISTLQAYEAGSKPGLEALVALARTANATLDWLLTGRGEKRPTGIPTGASLMDVIMVDQYQSGTSLSLEMIVGQIPFNRRELKNKLGLQEPTHETLLAIEARQNLSGLRRGDLVLIDREQAGLIEDGVYLFDLPGFALREISVFPNDWVLVTGSETKSRARKSPKPGRRSLKMKRSELLGDGRFRTSKVIGRAVLVLGRI
jgi:transcriptional regulator with XRE-family HTH domain